MTDTSRLYLVKDTSLFSGVWTTRTSYAESYILNHHQFKDGLLVSTGKETFHLKSLVRRVYNGYSKWEIKNSEFFLGKKEYSKNDTNYVLAYFENGDPLSIKEVYYKNRETSYAYDIRYHYNRSVSYYRLNNKKDGLVTIFRCKMNEFGDTISRYQMRWTALESTSTDLEYNTYGDTVKYAELVNDVITNLEVRKLQKSKTGLHILWDDGVLKNFISDSLIFANAKGKLISKTDFVTLANQPDNFRWGFVELENENKSIVKHHLLLYLFNANTYVVDTKESKKEVHKLLKNKERIVDKWLKLEEKP